MRYEVIKEDYIDMPAIVRQTNRKPHGFKHYRIDDLYETSLTEMDLIIHKLKMIFAGGAYDDKNSHASQEAPREVRERHLRRSLYTNRSTANQ